MQTSIHGTSAIITFTTTRQTHALLLS